ncbi:PfkB family carbohydrate kinase [Agrococcus lahaulensis]|uniref:PfkB family carbohydrate kinase n=1 Tax=Agrococcus lahaulensis TaxID=341722 RepID=UPI0006882E08|nr:PfkB family carbohydrate kinase [Agrococcus lahaulensis]
MDEQRSPESPQQPSVVVVGHAARDLVLRAGSLPDAGGSAAVDERIERLGGKGANIAVGVRQLHPSAAVALVAVLGDDAPGESGRREAVAAGIDVSLVARRGGTALLVDLVSGEGERRLLEHVTPESQVTTADVDAAEAALAGAHVVVLQLQQPADALVRAARIAFEGGARIVLDGAIEGDERDELLSVAEVVRADAEEASILAGVEVATRDDARRAAEGLLGRGARVVALSVPDEGDLVCWHGGERFLPHVEQRVVDPTGGGDAFVAGIVTGMLLGAEPGRIGEIASQAAGSTVQRLGGHPELSPPVEEG